MRASCLSPSAVNAFFCFQSFDLVLAIKLGGDEKIITGICCLFRLRFVVKWLQTYLFFKQVRTLNFNLNVIAYNVFQKVGSRPTENQASYAKTPFCSSKWGVL